MSVSSVAIQSKSRGATSVPALVMDLLHCRNQLKLFHWQTSGFGAHKALGDAVDALDEQTDQLLEVAFPLDKASVKSMASADTKHGYVNWKSRAATLKYVNAVIDKLKAAKTSYEGTKLGPIVFIIDEIVGGLLRLAYLLKFDKPKK